METLIRAAMNRSRATLFVLMMLVVGGIASYQTIPKEANPDVTIPIIYISMTLSGISPADSERLLARPMEQELRSLEGIKKMTSIAGEGHASVTLEFDAGFDPKTALQDVREKVDSAQSKLPAEADEATVHEINVALFPVMSVGLSGPVNQKQLIYIARRLQLELEGIPEVLEVDIAGDREDLLEIVVDPQAMDSYNLDYADLYSLVSNNNKLVAAGSLDTGAGRMTLKIPGVIENLEDVMNMPIKVSGQTVVTFKEVATIRRTFTDPEGFARINGQPGVVLEIKKRAGANIINTVDKVRALFKAAEPQLPKDLQVRYLMDQSSEVKSMLSDLLNNVMTAVILVLIIMLAAMGARAAFLVGLTIPGAFLTGILVVSSLGFTMNIIVLFSLILVAGMLVDGAIVVSELADRHQKEGFSRNDAWAHAASRMAWPIIASTLTTIMVFLPLLFWPGVMGEFMQYLPATVMICLFASLAMALIFLPVMGKVFGKREPLDRDKRPAVSDIDMNHVQNQSAGGKAYRRILNLCLNFPASTLVLMLVLMGGIYAAYGKFNHGMEFFPDVEPESAQLQVRTLGDFSVYEKDALLQRIENRLYGMPEVEAMYARSFAAAGGQLAEDVIGVIQFRFTDWETRRPANLILDEMRERTQDIPGVILEFRKQEGGPPSGKPVELRISGNAPEEINSAVAQIRRIMDELGGFADVNDDRALPGIEWLFEVDRAKAAQYGATISSVGNAVQLVSNGLKLASYRPEDASDEVDIRIRLPEYARTLDQLNRQSLNTPYGQVPLSNFVTLTPAPKTGILRRLDGKRTITISGDVAEGEQVNERLTALKGRLGELSDTVSVTFGGEDADQKESMVFLMGAFLVAILLMMLILIIQFNSIYQTLLVLSAIIFSTAGVLLGLLINGQAFGVVMVGMGIIALAGIVVNNNIVLIDTYNRIRAGGLGAFEAALETGCMRLRPVLLTALTTVLGLMPMVLGVNVNLVEHSLGWGAPSTQWWTQLSSAIAGGLTFATVLTLLLTPCMLVLGDGFADNRVFRLFRRLFSRKTTKTLTSSH
ncbi:efflux RND transporter permease subunit [Oceanospirillum sp.]|uniref:efflux RND transporter permease subunit n=1 Tax=Oceanospirillum sp. TaxID=2021254 RepID=UPI003A954A09